MKKIYLLFTALAVSIAATFAAPFTSGNIVVVRVGNGSAALTSAATPVFLDEYTPGGGFVQTIAMPTAVSGPNFRFSNSGTATSEGSINLSADRAFLSLAGYDAAVGTLTVTSTTSVANPRVVGLVDANGIVNTTTGLTDSYSANSIRSAYTTNGINIWTSGTATSTGGVRYTTTGASMATQLSTTLTNLRAVSVYNSQLYVSSASSTFFGVSSVGTGTPTTSGQTITLLPGFPSTTGPSPYAFEINPVQGNTMYVADDRTTISGGIQKWVLISGTWSLAYTINPAASTGARGLTVDWRTPAPIIYATGTTVAGLNSIYVITDNGSAATSTSTVIATSPANTAYRGVAFAPGTPVLPVTILSFDARKIGGINEINWQVSRESELKHYEVERSIDGKKFVTLGTVVATNNSSYSFNDTRPLSLNYYRLKSVDKNGSFAYSKTVVVINKENGFIISNVYPTVTTGKIVVESYAANATKVSYSISNMTGQRLLDISATANLNSRQVMDVQHLSTGMYLLKISSAEASKTFKIIKQ